MRQDLWIREGDIDGGKGIDVDRLSNGRVTITLGTYSNGVTLFMESDDALTIAHRILYVLRGDDETTEDDAPTIANRLWDALRGDDETIETAEAPEATAPVCDVCGKPVESDGDTGNEWWVHVDESRGGYTHLDLTGLPRVEVEGSRRVKDSVTNETTEVSESVTGPVCDNCGEPVVSDGYTGNEWWRHAGSVGLYGCEVARYRDRAAEVAGSRRVRGSATL